MKISFLCKYSGKENGFIDTVLNQNDYTLSLYSRTGTEYNLIKYGCGPKIFILLFTNEKGRLECVVRGLGRRTNLPSSPWDVGDEIRYATMVFCEEKEQDRYAVLSLARAFTTDFYRYGNMVLNSVIPAPEIQYIEYKISQETFSPFLEEIESVKKYHLKGELKPNRLVYYYTPEGLKGATFEKLCQFFVSFKDNNIEKLSKKVFCFESEKAKTVFEKSLVNFQFNCDNEDKPFPVKIGKTVVKAVGECTEAIKSLCCNKSKEDN